MGCFAVRQCERTKGGARQEQTLRASRASAGQPQLLPAAHPCSHHLTARPPPSTLHPPLLPPSRALSCRPTCAAAATSGGWRPTASCCCWSSPPPLWSARCAAPGWLRSLQWVGRLHLGRAGCMAGVAGARGCAVASCRTAVQCKLPLPPTAAACPAVSALRRPTAARLAPPAAAAPLPQVGQIADAVGEGTILVSCTKGILNDTLVSPCFHLDAAPGGGSKRAPAALHHVRGVRNSALVCPASGGGCHKRRSAAVRRFGAVPGRRPAAACRAADRSTAGPLLHRRTTTHRRRRPTRSSSACCRRTFTAGSRAHAPARLLVCSCKACPAPGAGGAAGRLAGSRGCGGAHTLQQCGQTLQPTPSTRQARRSSHTACPLPPPCWPLTSRHTHTPWLLPPPPPAGSRT